MGVNLPRLVGARVARREDPRLLTGQGSYVDDHRPPQMLYAAFLRSPHAHARLARIDASAALALPGVVAVLTGEDIARAAKPVRAESKTPSVKTTSFPPLALGKVRHVGEAVVMVAAESRYVAEDAVERIVVEFEPLPVVKNTDEALDPASPVLHEDAGTNLLVSREFARGDVDGALAGAALVVRERFRFHRHTPVCMENRGCLADYATGSQTLTLRSSAQCPGLVRDILTDLLEHAGAPDPRDRERRRRRLRRQGFALSRGDRHVRDGATTRAPGEVDRRSPRGPALDHARLGRDRRRRARPERGRHHRRASRAGHRRRRRLLDLSVDRRHRAGADDQLPARALQGTDLSRADARRGDLQGAARAVPRRRAAARGVRDRGPDGSRRAPARDRSDRDPAPQFHPGRRLSLQVAVGDRVGPVELHRLARPKAREALDYKAARDEQARARADGRWLGIGVASYVELTGIGSAIPVSPGMPVSTGHRGGDDPLRPRGQGHRGVRRRVAWPGPRDDPGADRGGRSRRADRGRARAPRRYGDLALRDRHLREPQSRAGRRRGHPRRPSDPREDGADRRPSAGGRPGRRHGGRRPLRRARDARPERGGPTDRPRRLLGCAPAPEGARAGPGGDQVLRSVLRHRLERDARGGGRGGSRDPAR